jgi:hypothetical protein
VSGVRTRPLPRRDVHEQPFWEFVQRGELRLQRCDACRRFRYPPAPVCPDCLAGEHGWEQVAGSGRLLSWVVFHRQYFPELPPPYHVAAAEIPEGPILIANLVNLAGREPRVDMPVRLTYEQALDDDGRPWQIYQWEPA